jgi:CheY-like chemotaxis protein
MKPRVLIVDDEFGLAEVIAEILCERGYDTAMAMNGKLALAEMQQTLPQFVLLDVMMPVMDGPSLLLHMQQDPRLASVPVALMSSLAESSFAAVRGLYREFVRKPFTPEALYALVERYAGRPECP